MLFKNITFYLFLCFFCSTILGVDSELSSQSSETEQSSDLLGSEQTILAKVSDDSTLGADETVQSDLIESQINTTASDIFPAQGTLSQSYMDLKLPGPPGLDLAITRTYSSRHYTYKSNANPMNNNFWGGSLGNGWFLSTDMRATVAIGDMVHRRRVFVEISGEMDSYEYNQTDGYFYSRDPKNKNRVFIPEIKDATAGQTISSILLETPTGFTYRFEELIFQRDYTSGTDYDLMPCVRTFMLSTIENKRGQSISLEYESFKIDFKEFITTGNNSDGIYIIGDHEHWFSDVKGYADRKGYYKRTKTVIDSYERHIDFHYDKTPYHVTSIDYINGNGTKNTIHYDYNSEGYLNYVYLTANNKAFPGMKYFYTNYEPSFKKFYYSIVR